MEYQYIYANLIERQQKVDEAEALGYMMLHDDFDPDWKPGDEPHGVMTFTDVILPSPIPEPPRDLAAEIDKLRADIKELIHIIARLR